MTAITQVVAPQAEPLDLATAKVQLRVTDTSQDTLIGVLVSAARQFAEAATRRQLLMANWKMVVDRFPNQAAYGTPQVPAGDSLSYPGWSASPKWRMGNWLVLPVPPVVSVESIKYVDLAGEQQTLDPSLYLVDMVTELARISPVYGAVWPATREQQNAVEVLFTAGHAHPVTINTSTDIISNYGPGKTYAAGDIVRFDNVGGALPAPLAARTNYYVVNPTASTFQVALTAGGAAIDLTTGGSGVVLCGEVPEGIKSWMLIRIATLYDNRAEIDQNRRGKISSLPYVDGLLDTFKVMGL